MTGWSLQSQYLQVTSQLDIKRNCQIGRVNGLKPAFQCKGSLDKYHIVYLNVAHEISTVTVWMIGYELKI